MTSLASPSAVSTAAPVATPSPTPTATASPRPALVGQWELDRTCQAIVAALTKAGHPELIRGGAGELVQGNINGEVPSDWDSKHPCAMALPPTPHSHTFWLNGVFNSYDENGKQVDDGRQCRDDLGWMYSVSFPGSAWHRVTSGPHVP